VQIWCVMCRRHDGEADLLPIVDLAVLLPPQNTATTESLRGFSYEAGLAVLGCSGETRVAHNHNQKVARGFRHLSDQQRTTSSVSSR